MSTSMTQEEKEQLANCVVSLLKSEDPRKTLNELAKKVQEGDEGEEGMNSVVLAISTAMIEHFTR